LRLSGLGPHQRGMVVRTVLFATAAANPRRSPQCWRIIHSWLPAGTARALQELLRQTNAGTGHRLWNRWSGCVHAHPIQTFDPRLKASGSAAFQASRWGFESTLMATKCFECSRSNRHTGKEIPVRMPPLRRWSGTAFWLWVSVVRPPAPPRQAVMQVAVIKGSRLVDSIRSRSQTESHALIGRSRQGLGLKIGRARGRTDGGVHGRDALCGFPSGL